MVSIRRFFLIGIVSAFMLALILGMEVPQAHAVGEPRLFLNPGSGSFLVGSTFDVSVVLDTKDQAVNTVEVELLFPPDRLQLANPSLGTSIIQLWPSPPSFSNREGRAYFIGGIPSPGITTSQGIVLTLTFRVIAPGEAKVSFGENTSVLANDGFGTDILGKTSPAFYALSVPPPLGPTITSPTHPDDERWYRDPNPIFIWDASRSSDGFSYTLDRNPSGIPDTILDTTDSTVTFSDLDDGLWYFHLRERRGGVWGGVSHYVVRVDTQQPAEFKIDISHGARTRERNPIFRFFTTDSLSGFDHFEMKIVPLSRANTQESFFFEVVSPFQASSFDIGRHQVIVRAVDKAGNSRDESVIMTVVDPVYQLFTDEGIDIVLFFLPWATLIDALAIVSGILIVTLIIIWRHHHTHLRHSLKDDLRKFMRAFTGKKYLFLIIGIGFISALFSVPAYARQAAPPTITVAPQTYYPLDEVLYIEGHAEPQRNVQVFLERARRNPVVIQTQANSNGEWFIAERPELESGEWSARARVLSDPISEWSNPRIIRSIVSGFTIGGIRVKYAPIVGVLFILIVGSVGLLIYSAVRIKINRRREIERQMSQSAESFKKTIREKEKDAVESVVDQEFAQIRQRVMDELNRLEARAKNGVLTVQEAAHRQELLSLLEDAEERIEKRIEDIS